MHDYIGNPSFPQAVSLIDDSDSPNAGNFGAGFEGALDRTSYLRALIGANAAVNWHTGTFPLSGQTFIAAYFGRGYTNVLGATVIALDNLWALTAWDGGVAGAFWSSVDNGRTFTSIATAGSGFIPIVKCLTDTGGGVGFCQFGRSSKVYRYDGTGTIATVSSSGWDATFGVSWFNATTSKSYFVGGLQSGGSFTGSAASYAVPTTVVNLSGNLPTGWVSGTNHPGEFFAANDGTTYLVAMGGVTAGVDTARLLNAGVLSAPTDITPAICTGKIISGIAWDSTRSLWLMALNNSTDSFLYSSPDHITWTLVRQVPNATLKGIFPIGGALATVVTGSRGGSASADFYVSKDEYLTFDAALLRADVGALLGGNQSILFASDSTRISFSEMALI